MDIRCFRIFRHSLNKVRGHKINEIVGVLYVECILIVLTQIAIQEDNINNGKTKIVLIYRCLLIICRRYVVKLLSVLK